VGLSLSGVWARIGDPFSLSMVSLNVERAAECLAPTPALPGNPRTVLGMAAYHLAAVVTSSDSTGQRVNWCASGALLVLVRDGQARVLLLAVLALPRSGPDAGRLSAVSNPFQRILEQLFGVPPIVTGETDTLYHNIQHANLLIQQANGYLERRRLMLELRLTRVKLAHSVPVKRKKRP